MSIKYLNLAFESDVKPSGARFILVALCNFANEDGLAYPTIETLGNCTGQNRKSVMSNLSKLCANKFIVDTGEKTGKKGVTRVYKINLEVVPKTVQYQKRYSTKNGTSTSPKNGTIPKTVLHPGNPHSDAVCGEVVPKTVQYQKRYSEPSVLNHHKEPSSICGGNKNNEESGERLDSKNQHPAKLSKSQKLEIQVSDDLGVDLEKVRVITQHRRDIGKPANTAKKISLVISGMLEAVQLGYAKTFDECVEYYSTRTEWQGFRPEWYRNAVSGGSNGVSGAGVINDDDTSWYQELQNEQY